jgi:hypothetical protein
MFQRLIPKIRNIKKKLFVYPEYYRVMGKKMIVGGLDIRK